MPPRKDEKPKRRITGRKGPIRILNGDARDHGDCHFEAPAERLEPPKDEGGR